jgi:hypothetical protein
MMPSNSILAALLFLATTRISEAGCPGNCEPNGKCVSGSRNVYCECKPGFTGSDCSFPYEQCPDGYTTCLNGAKCVSTISNNEVYQCDCTQIPDATPFKIDQCKNPIDDICEKGVKVSEHAFCTNDGICRSMVEQGEQHPGCECPEEYEGRHCQYAAGSAPPEELLLVWNEESDATMLMYTDNDMDRTDVGASMVVAGCILIFVGGFSFFVFHRLSQLSAEQNDKKNANKLLSDLRKTGDMTDMNFTDVSDIRVNRGESVGESARNSFVDILLGEKQKSQGEMA